MVVVLAGERRAGTPATARGSPVFEVVDLWGREHAREYSDFDRFHADVRKYSLTRAAEIPDRSDFDDDPATIAYKVAAGTWKWHRPVHSNNWRWHGDANYDLAGRDAAALAMRTLGVSQEAIGELHGISQTQVSKRLRGAKNANEGVRITVRVSCRACGTVFSAVRTSARVWGKGTPPLQRQLEPRCLGRRGSPSGRAVRITRCHFRHERVELDARPCAIPTLIPTFLTVDHAMSAHGWGFYFLPGVTSDDVSRAILRDSNYPDGTVVYGMRRRTCAGCSSPLTSSPLTPRRLVFQFSSGGHNP